MRWKLCGIGKNQNPIEMESIGEIVASDVGTRWHWQSESECPAILLFPYTIQARRLPEPFQEVATQKA
jgi:carbonic anhydrase